MGFSWNELNEINAEWQALSEDSNNALVEIFRILGVYEDPSKQGRRKQDRTKDPQRVKELLESSPRLHPNIRSHGYGETMLANAHYYEMVKVLLQAGADPNQERMMDGQNALDHLFDDDMSGSSDDDDDDDSELSEEDQRIAELLRAHGAKRSPSLQDQLNEAIAVRTEEELAAAWNSPFEN
jgi:hypothetical protein